MITYRTAYYTLNIGDRLWFKYMKMPLHVAGFVFNRAKQEVKIYLTVPIRDRKEGERRKAGEKVAEGSVWSVFFSQKHPLSGFFRYRQPHPSRVIIWEDEPDELDELYTRFSGPPERRG